MGMRNREDNRFTPSRQLSPCPLCGKQPVILCTDVTDEKPEYKCFCTGNGTHIGCGDWKSTPQLAEEDWERRVQNRTQPDLIDPTNFDVVKNIIANDITVEAMARALYHNTFYEIFDVPGFETEEEMLEWLKADKRKALHLKFLGTDSHDRQVFEDQNGRLWKNTEIFTHRAARLCTVLNNAFDGEPDTPMSVMDAYKNVELVFLPKEEARNGHQ